MLNYYGNEGNLKIANLQFTTQKKEEKNLKRLILVKLKYCD